MSTGCGDGWGGTSREGKGERARAQARLKETKPFPTRMGHKKDVKSTDKTELIHTHTELVLCGVLLDVAQRGEGFPLPRLPQEEVKGR